MARHGRRLLALLDDDPVTPADPRRTYTHGAQARQVLNDAEEDLKNWVLQLDEVKEATAQLESSGDADATPGAVSKSPAPAHQDENKDAKTVPGSL